MGDWDAQKLLDKYILDYMIKHKMHDAAAIFAQEANVPFDPVLINPSEGFLKEWWSIFWETYSNRVPTPDHPEAMEGSSSEVPTHGLRPNDSQNAGNESLNNPLESWRDMISMLQNTSPDQPQSGLPTREMMPSPYTVDSHQSALPTTIPSSPPSALSTTMQSPELNPNNSGSSPSSSDINSKAQDSSTNFFDTLESPRP